MRTLNGALQAHLQSSVTTLAHVWIFTRRDSQVFGFTDHDQPLIFGGVTCAPGAGLAAGALEKSLGLNVDTASVAGALNSSALDETDLVRGLWDGARVELHRVNWGDVSQSTQEYSGTIGEVRRGAQAFEAELRGLQHALNVPVGRVFSRFCDADVGDARCGVNLEAAAYKGAGAVTSVLSANVFKVSGIGTFAPGWFVRGRLVWSAGGEGEVSAHRLQASDVVLELLEEPPTLPSVGAAFTVYAGCDKRAATCRAKFANTANFRGFPHMPGNDAVQARPGAGELMDGSSRFL